MFVSEIFAIEDCWRYIPTKYTSTQSNLNYTLPDGAFSIEWNLHRTNGTGSTNASSYLTLRNNSYELAVGQVGSVGQSGILGRTIGAGSWSINQQISTPIPNDTEKVIKYTYDNGVHTISWDTNSISVTNTSYAPSKLYEMVVQSLNKIEYLKIKPL